MGSVIPLISPEDKKALIALFDDKRVLMRNGVRYLDFPFFNHSIATDPKIVRKLVQILVACIDWNQGPKITKLVSEEEYGGFLTACLAMETGIPFTLAKQNAIHQINGIGVTFFMGYNQEMTLYLNGVEKGDRVVIIDDLIDSGGTMIALIRALQEVGAEIAAIIVLAERAEKHGSERVKQETGCDVILLTKVDTSSEKTKVVWSIFDK